MVSCSQRWLAVLGGIFSLLLAGPPEIRAADTPLLAISTSPQNQPVSMTLRDSKLRYEFTVDSLKDAVLEGVQVTATPFMDAAGNRIQPRVTLAGDATGASKPVEALKSLPVVIEADFPDPGVYTSSIHLIYNKQRWTPPLTLTVTRAAPEIDVPDILPAGTVTLWSGREEARAHVDVGVYEKNGQILQLALPQLKQIVRKGENAARYSATASFKILGSRRRLITTPLTLKNRETQQLRFELSDFSRAGEYEAGLRFTPKGAAPIDRVFSVYVREPLWAAALWIAAGVLISWAIREYLVKIRPRLAVLARMESLAVDLENALQGAVTNEQRSVIGSLRSHVAELRKALGLETLGLGEIDNALDLIEKKIPLLQGWIEVYPRLPQPVPAEQKSVLDRIEITLRNPAASAQEIATAQSDLAALASTIPVPESAAAARDAAEGQPAAAQKLESLLRRIRSSDSLITAVVLAIAILMGIKALWLSDLSWGGWDDRVVAVLWGLGLHQATFSGVEALRSTLIK